MNKKQICILVALCLAFVSAQDPPRQDQSNLIRNNIIDKFVKKGNTKELFKVWHFLYNRSVDYEVNSEKGINSYRTFKKNLKMVQEHNAKNLSYKLGINEFSDKTYKEFMEYFNIREEGIPVNEFRKLAGFNLDDYDDTQETSEVVRVDPPRKNLKFDPIDYTEDFKEARYQGRCGSCWTFSTTGAMEANYFIQAKSNDGKNVEKVYFSPQQLVDCDKGQGKYGGCSGGWMKTALEHFKVKNPQLDEDYPYEATVGTCRYKENGKFVANVMTYEFTNVNGAQATYGLLVNGPIAGCVNATPDFKSYYSGVFDGECSEKCNHAIVIMGYGYDAELGKSYWKGRNSWSNRWGENGYFRVEDNDSNAYSCMMTFNKYSAKPVMKILN